jgi:AraC family transcriptional regulator, alkane utilization regulator
MIGTPRSFAATPPQTESPGDDVLADMLRAVRLTGAVYLNGCFTAPFGIISPKHFEANTPMAHMRHVSVFHLISSGACSVELASGESRTVSAGDVLLMPFADEHVFRSGQVEAVPADDIIRPGPVGGMWNVNCGGGGEETRIVCGFLESSEFLLTPVFRTLPPLLIQKADEDQASALIASTVRQILVMADEAAPGTELMLGRLMEVLFVEVLRRYASKLPPSAKGLLAALNDPIVGRAVHLVHADPTRRWTVDDLAREVGSSRTVLAERFHAVFGRAPIEYITAWRMQLAAERIKAGHESLAAIAADIGYDSEAAFNRAFKRVTGVTPGRWRDSESPAVLMTRLNAAYPRSN